MGAKGDVTRIEFGSVVKSVAFALGALIAVAGIAANILGVSGPIADPGLDALVVGSIVWLIGSVLGAGISNGHVRTRAPAITFACVMIIFFVRSCSPPPLLWGTYLDPNPDHYYDEGKTITKALIRQYPIGSPAKNLRIRLSIEGFKFGGRDWDTRAPGEWYDQSARYGWGTFPCGDDVLIRWDEDQAGRITKLQVFYGRACL